MALVWLGIWVASGWGTVTLEFENRPLGQVLDSFTRQTKLPVLTDLDRTRSVTIQVRRVTVTEALEAIRGCADSRGGRLAFLLAPDAAGLARIRALLPRPPEDSGILSLEFRIPFPALANLEELPEWRDPRDQTWQPSSNLPRQLVPAAENAAQAADIRILLPRDWNPPLPTLPKGGTVTSSLTALAKLAKGQVAIAYILPAPRADGSGGRDSPGGGWGNREEGFGRAPMLSPEKWTERLAPRLASLPREEQAAARTALAESAGQFKEWDTLPPEQRREKIQALMQNPASSEKMSNRFMQRMRNLTPQQRAERYQSYNERRESIKDPERTR